MAFSKKTVKRSVSNFVHFFKKLQIEKETSVASGHLQRGRWESGQFRQYVFVCDSHLITGGLIMTCVPTESVNHSKLEKHHAVAVQ